MGLLSIASDAVTAADQHFEKAAARVVESTMTTDPTLPQDSLSLSNTMVGMIEAQRSFEVQTKVFHAADEQAKHTLDILG